MNDDRALARVPRPVDAAAAAVVLAIVILGTANIPVGSGDRPMDALAFLCGIAGAVSLVFWRSNALVVAVVIALTTAVYAGRNYAGGPALLPGPLALLALGYMESRRIAWLGAAGYVTLALAGRLAFGESELAELLILVGWATAAVLAGQALAARGERAAAERDRQAHAQQQALAAERLRIAQDLHDSVAHAMATINVQSGVAAHLLEREPGQAKGALEAIRSASSDALDELTAIVSVLRTSNGGVAESAPRAPLASLRELSGLVERSRADGLVVELGVRGDVGSLSPTVSAAAYRVVQEALTNSRRHAGATARTRVEVVVDARGALSVLVADDGGEETRPSTIVDGADSGGFGLVGMRERVESTGGSLATGHRSGGGFEVVASWGPRS